MRNLLILFLLLVVVQSLIAQDFEKGEYLEVPIHEQYVEVNPIATPSEWIMTKVE